MSILWTIIIGFLAGMLGIGGGVIILPILVYLVGQGSIVAARTSLVLVWTSSLLTTVYHATATCDAKDMFQVGNVNFKIGSMLLAGGLIGSFVGHNIQERISGKSLRRWFCLIVGAALVMVIYEMIKIFS